ncbi:branched-chain-amino-acid transaminase bat2 [Collariella sp. IMI 366227]|nr:branched-chain-amino-acid transaminase bat2 [Collariella sp. IMI 366227]
MLRQLLPRCAPRAAALVAPRRAPLAIIQAARQYSVKPEAASKTKLQDIDPSQLVLKKTGNPKPLRKSEELIFGQNFTATCVFHYAFECFEGMKAYKDKAGQIRLFRPDKNMERFNKSSARIALPNFSSDALTELIAEFTKLESRFIPSERGYSLYLRPTMIGTQKTLGVTPPGSAMLFVIASPVGPYYPTGFKAVSLEATDYAVRAWPGGVGDKKLGANYAPCIVPQREAMSRGFQQNLWLFGEEEFVTEVGTMNFFVAMRNKETGQKELLTAPLDGTILEGVTRDSVLSLARERLVPEGWNIVERKYTISEMDEAAREGRLMEAFGSGTAAIVSPVRAISWKGKMVHCGLKDHEESGEIATKMKNWIEARQYGDDEHEWSYVC